MKDNVGDGVDGIYDIDTSNQLIGLQLGWGHTYDTGRWGVNTVLKGGAFHNDSRGRLIFDRDDSATQQLPIRRALFPMPNLRRPAISTIAA